MRFVPSACRQYLWVCASTCGAIRNPTLAWSCWGPASQSNCPRGTGRKTCSPGCVNPDDLEVVNSSKLTAVPDCNGVRFCRVCNEFLPICAFPTGQRRYTCKTHLWMRVGIKAQKKLFAKPRKKLLSSIWNSCYKDGQRLARCLGLGARDLSPTLTQADIGSMLDAGADALGPQSSPQRSQVGVDQMTVMPINLMAPLSTENAAFVTKAERQRLFAKLRSVQMFLKAKPSEDKPVEACREQLESVWRRHVESVSILPRMNRYASALARGRGF
jgi:hypothetical protein